MSLFLGIDQSVLHTGICILNEDAGVMHLGLIEPKNIVNYERLVYIRDELKQILHGRRFDVGVMEGYSYGSINKKFLLGEVGAVIKMTLFDHCDSCFDAAPKQLKKFVCSRGSASKEDVIFSVEKQWGVVVDNDNLADAYVLARIGYEIARPSTKKRHQLDIINMLKSKDLKKERKTRIKRQYKDAI